MPSTPSSVMSSDSTWQQSLDQLETLPALPIEERAKVVEQLIRNPRPGIRERALRVGIAVLADETLVDFLRSDADAVIRNAGLEILKQKGSQSLGVARKLLKDPDPDVALQAVLILDHVKDPRGLEPLRGVLKHNNPNIVQAAIVAVGHLGDRRVIDDLLPFLHNDLWLQMAAIQALGDLRSPEAIEPLSRLLTDLMAGPTAAEAIAQIGGDTAFGVLSLHWLEYRDTLDPETAIGLLAHVLEGLPEAPDDNGELRESLAGRLRDPFQGVRYSSARCLLALGPGPEDTEALSVLAAAQPDGSVLPSCLRHRPDLMPALLGKDHPQAHWGFLLYSVFPNSVPTDALIEGLDAFSGQELQESMLEAVSTNVNRALAEPLLRLYRRTDIAQRSQLVPALRAHGDAVVLALEEDETLTLAESIVLEAILGTNHEKTAARVRELPRDLRLEILTQLLDEGTFLRLLPWAEWLEDEPAQYLRLAAVAASMNGMRELLPHIRSTTKEHPIPDAIRALGELRDSESVPLLLSLCEGAVGALKPLIIESLGRIGGPQARKALHEFAESENDLDARLAFRALAKCASEQDDEIFRKAASSTDWCIRLAAVEALARFSRPENLRTLSELAADSVAIVAQKALAALRSQ